MAKVERRHSPSAIAAPHVAAWRRWFGFSQEELAQAAGIHVDVLRHIEQALNPASAKSIRKIADALGIDRPTLIHLPPEQAEDEAWCAAKTRRAHALQDAASRVP
jgi:transcriptional regulator with XRE-family HTH domain